MPNPSNIYTCPRCLYETSQKWMMKRHLLSSKKPCAQKTGVVLTSEIIDEVLLNYKWLGNSNIILDSDAPNVYQTNNNYNTITAMVSNMESLDKIKMITNYYGTRQLDFEDRLEYDFQAKIDKLDNDEYTGGYCISCDGFLELVDCVTKMDTNETNRFNVLFDKTINRINILSCGKWDSYLEEIGIKEIIRLLKSYFLDNYEIYLIKHLNGNDIHKNRFILREHLDIYYNFIAAFDLDASVCSQTDVMIMGRNIKENNDYHLAEYYGKIYRDIKGKIKTTEKNNTKRRISAIIKENTTHNLNKVNKIMLDLIKTDPEFLNQLIENRKLPNLG